MSVRFDAAALAALRAEDEVEIETSAGEDGPIHRTIIWVVVDDRWRVLIRSYRGAGARWFREIMARPDTLLHVRGQALPVRAIPATDAERVTACSDEFGRKYAGHHSVKSMVTRYLETTLELLPR
jgi:hypothetical protein